MTMVEISKVAVSEAYYPRVQVDWHVAYEYVEALRAGAKFPPIAVVEDAGVYVLIDGAHRLEAHKRAKRDRIAADVLKLPRDKWLEEAVRRNAANARRFSVQEKVRIFEMLRRAGYPLGRIGEITYTPVASVKKMLADRVVRIRAGGLERQGGGFVVRKRPFMDAEANDSVALEAAQDTVASRSQLHLFEQILAILRGGFLDRSDEKVLAAAEALRDELIEAVPIAARKKAS